PVTDAKPSGLAMDKIAEFDKLIRSGASDADKAVAIAWLEHLIGDIHQPLHASSRVTDSNADGDQGGNLFLLTPKGTPRNQQENLHHLWDAIVLIYQPNTKDLPEADYLYPIGDDIMKLYPYDKLKGDLADGKFDVWKDESYKIASTEAYTGIEWFKPASDAYKKRAFEIAQRRIALAGYRMADEFNDAFSARAPIVTGAPGQQ
ncbi:MAG: S1/P1 nuclease, partial [Acidobacteria bacterium]|nr:S1/P1 nuclease [Acidobacteriota bacterium]